MSPVNWRRPVAGAAICALTVTTMALVPTAAFADVVPGNEADVGVYTNGETDSMDIGDPTYLNVERGRAEAEPRGRRGPRQHARPDLRQGPGGRRHGLLPRPRARRHAARPTTTVLQTRGRSLYMRGGSNWTVMGFAGSAFAGGPNNLGNFYTVAVPGSDRRRGRRAALQRAQPREVAVHDRHDRRRRRPAQVHHVRQRRRHGDHLHQPRARRRRRSPSAPRRRSRPAPATPTTSSSARRTSRAGANNGLVDTPWSTVTIGLKADGFARQRHQPRPRGHRARPAARSSCRSSASLYTDALPEPARTSSRSTPSSTAADAFSTGVTEFNRRWAQDIPYIDVPERGHREGDRLPLVGRALQRASTRTSRATSTSTRRPSRA